MHIVANYSAMLICPVIVTRDCARTDVNVLTDAAVAYIGQVISFGSLTKLARLHLNEITDVHCGGELGTGAQPGIGANACLGANFGAIDK